MTQATVSRIEGGQFTPRGRTLARLAQGLGVDPEALADYPPSPLPTGRHEIDALAKMIVTGDYPRDPARRKQVLQFALWIGEKLRAQGVPGFKRIQRQRLRARFRPAWIKSTYPPGLLNHLLSRVDKYLARYAR